MSHRNSETVFTYAAPTSKAVALAESRGSVVAPEMKFAVVCQKSNGRRYLFRTYAVQVEAEAAAKALRDIGCIASVSDMSDYTPTENDK